MKVDAIIQARMGSTRLPGKVLMRLNSETSLECLMNQIAFSKSLDKKVIATTTNKEDDTIFELANSKGFDVFRGNSIDVIDRFYQCAMQYKMKSIVRLTADNPLIDPQLLDMVIQTFEMENFDYVSNCLIRTFPFGTEVEIFSFETLKRIWKNAKMPADREHITTYIVNNQDNFSCKNVSSNTNLSYLRWTIDEKEDFEFVKTLYLKIKNHHPILLKDIIDVIEKNPSILEINEKTAKKYHNQI